MRNAFIRSIPFLTFFLFPFNLAAQGPAAGSIGLTSGVGGTTTQGQLMQNFFSPEMQKLIAGRVYTQRGEPVAKATVEVTNNIGSPFQSAITDKQGDFQFEFHLYDVELGKQFAATIKVTRKGFQVGHKIVFMDQKTHETSFAMTLRPNSPEDANMFTPSELVKELAARLQKLGPSDGLSKAQKDYDKGVQEFQAGRHLDSAIVSLHKAAIANPNCLKCRTMLGLAEMSWNDWDGAQVEFGESVNAIIKDKKLGSVEPFLAYGTMVSWKHDPAKASAYYLEALTFSPNDPLALRELGRTQCQELNWYSCNLTLKKALAAGAGPECRLMRSEALVYVGTPKDATDELDLYMKDAGLKGPTTRVKAVQARIQERKKDEVAFRAAAIKAQAKGIIPVDYLHNPPKNLPDFVAIADQSQLNEILTAVGKNVSELFSTLPNICSIEKVQQEKLTRDGKPSLSLNSKYRYLATAPSHPWGPSIDEYRADWHGKVNPQMGLSEDSMLTEGFVSPPLPEW